MEGLKELTSAFVPWFLASLLLFQVVTVRAQVNLGPDTTVCANTPLTLDVYTNGLVGTPVVLTDDRHSGVIPIGFPFTYFGNTYNNLVIASNNYITFDLTTAGTAAPWNITAAIPSATLPTNAIMGPYQDINPNTGGAISYITIGTAPNRIFVVTFFEVPMFSCSSLCFTNQIKLFEGSNNIEIHIGNKPLCGTWNNGVAIEGIQNATGTIAYAVPGRNYPTQWTAVNDGYRFSPTGPTTYNLSSIAYNSTNVLSPGNGVQINWYEGNTLLSGGTSPTITVNPTQNTTYTGEVVYDCSGLVFTDDINVTVVQPNVSVTPTNATVCVGQSVNLTASGAQTYSWAPVASLNQSTGVTVAASPSSTTTYTVTGTDNVGCTATATATVNIGASFNTSISNQTNVSCAGSSDGSATATANGGVPPYTYQWSNGQNGATANNLAAGTYTVTITDNTSCAGPLAVTITEPQALSASMASPQSNNYNISCNGASTGSIDLTPNGGTSPFNYTWSDGSYSQDLNNIMAGTYTVTLTDANGCNSTNSITLSEPPAMTATLVPTNANCNGNNDGAVDITVSGGANPYTYNWNNGATTEDISNLAAGTYIVTVTDANGCTASFSQTLTEPSGLTVSLSSSSFAGGNNISCNGASDGSIDLSVAGGTLPYSYNWSNGASSEDLSNLSGGAYTVTVTGGNGCIVTASTILVEPAVLSVTLSPQVYTSGSNISCAGDNDGSIDLSTMGGASPYSYQWSNGYNTEDISALTAGGYTVSITDANGCTVTEAVTLTEPATMSSSIASPTANGGYNVSCESGTDGSIDLTVSGGAALYSYSWNGGQSTEDLTNVSAGYYEVTITDGNGCVLIDSLTLTEPQALAAYIIEPTHPSGNNISCFGLANGIANLSAVGGTSPYTYNWSNGATTEDLNNVAAGNYTVTITDANGCTSTGISTLTEPAELVSNINSPTFPSGDNISCNGLSDGEIEFEPSGGSTPFSYVWSNNASTEDLTGLTAGSYTVTLTDQNGCTLTETITLTEPTTFAASITTTTDASCSGGNDGTATVSANGGAGNYSYNWNNGQSTPIATDLSVGAYTVTVSDDNGCTITDDTTITSPSSLNADITSSMDITCNKGNDGEATVTATGGSSPYAYLWSDGQVATNAIDLSAGIYSVTVTDNQGCISTASITLIEPDSLTLSATAIDTICIGSSTTLAGVVNGGTPGYSYSWSSTPADPSLSNNLPNPTVSPVVSTDYELTVTDSNGCIAIFPVINIPVNQPLNISTDIVGPAGICPGESTIIGYTATGGDGNYYFTSNTSLTSLPPDQTVVTPPSSTTYTFIVNDGCGTPTDSTTVDIEVFPLPVPVFSTDPMEGCVPLEVNFTNTSTNAVSYRWDFDDTFGSLVSNAFEPTHTFQEAGGYYVKLVATSAEGCKDSITSVAPIVVRPLPNVSFDFDPKTINLHQAWIDFEDETDDAVSWYWDFGDGASSMAQYPEHLYTDTGEFIVWLTTETQYGCLDSTEAIVRVTPDVFVYIPNAFTPDGDGLNDEFMASTYGMDDLNLSMRVFNRWGEQVYFTQRQHEGWDGYFKGTEAPQGAYTYIIKIDNGDQEIQKFSGRVYLIR